ncbi:MAG: YkvA family protein [Peptostreptococcaceae bacterium]|nr:YkvA family protein [Peptostreptococcaceae bacterium]
MNNIKKMIQVLKKINVLISLLNDNTYKLKERLKALVFIIISFIYFISPIDLVPEIVLGFGFLDDLTVLAFLLLSMDDIISNYEIYKNKSIKENKIVDIKDYKIDNVKTETDKSKFDESNNEFENRNKD